MYRAWQTEPAPRAPHQGADKPLNPANRPFARETLPRTSQSSSIRVREPSGYFADREYCLGPCRCSVSPQPASRQVLERVPNQFGFTLIELMITIVVLAVLLGIGVPSFQETIRLNRTAAVTNDLVTGLQFARSEAIRRGQAVRFCAGANDGATTCNAGNLNNGWYVTTDLTDPPAAANAVRVWPAPRAGVELQNATTTTPTTNLAVDFNALGATAGGATIRLRHAGCSGNRARQVEVRQMGSVTTGAIACW